MLLEIGAALVPMISPPSSDLAQKLKTLRGRFATDFGFVLPAIRIKDSIDLGLNEYRLLVQGVEVAKGEVRPGLRMAMAPGGGLVQLPGERMRDPAFGLEVTWIDPALAEQAEASDCTVISPEGVIVTHVAEAVKENLDRFMTYAATERLIEQATDAEYAKLVRDLVPSQISMVGIMQVLQGLLVERVSIRNMPAILEAIAEAVGTTRSIPRIIEHVRFRLADLLCAPLLDHRGMLPAITLSGDWEREIAESIVIDGEERRVNLPPERVRAFMQDARSKIQAHANSDTFPSVVVLPEARPFIRSLLNRISPATPVLSHAEIGRKVQIQYVDVIGAG